MAENSDQAYLSILVPVYNEEGNIALLGEELAAVVETLGMTVEVLFIDDGSTDGSYAEILKLVEGNRGFKAVRLGRNAGQTAALSAGIQNCSGELIACLDADLQNDPQDIPLLLDKLGEGYDVVSGWRKDRQEPWLTRRLPSRLANALISWITGVPLHDYGCTLKLYRAKYLRPVKLYGEMHRFVPALAGFLGARIAEVCVNQRPRLRGRSKYGLSRTFKVLLDLLTVRFMEAYMAKPIYLFGGGGILMGFLGLCMAMVTLYNKFWRGIFVKDQPLFQVSIFFALVGGQLILLGLLAEILIRVYFDIKEKHPYFVRETAGFN